MKTLSLTCLAVTAAVFLSNCETTYNESDHAHRPATTTTTTTEETTTTSPLSLNPSTTTVQTQTTRSN